MKRPSDSFEDRDNNTKRRKTDTIDRKRLSVKHVQPGSRALLEHPQDSSIFERQLNRAICVGLHTAGFGAVKGRALESFRGIVEEYMHHFSTRVASSMKHCRRSQPLPQDFIVALSHFGLNPSDLLPELDFQVPAKVTQEPILPASPDTISAPFIPEKLVLDPEDTAQPRRSYIPPHLPTFPGQHAYRETPIFVARETDALRVRERAKEEGMQAETALRKLMVEKARKAGDRRREINRGRPPELEEQSQEAYAKALAVLRAKDAENRMQRLARTDSELDGVEEERPVLEEEVTTAVDYDRLFWRRGKA